MPINNHQQIIQMPADAGHIEPKTDVQDGQFRHKAIAASTPKNWCNDQLITPEIATRMLTDFEYPGQRIIRPFLVTRLARQMALGRWKYSPIKLAHMGDKTFLVDGQHRLRAIVMAGSAQTMCVMNSICTNDFEVAEEYNSCGTVMGARTNTDALRASGITERLNIGRTATNKLIPAANIILTGFAPRPTRFLMSRDDIEQQEVMEEYKAPYEMYLDTIIGANLSLKKIVMWGGFIAAALVIFETDKTRADTFFRTFAHDAPNLPSTYALQNYVLQLSGGASVSQLHVAHAVASAWARFRTSPNGAVKQLQIMPIDKPIVIIGSPYYTGRQEIDPLAFTFRNKPVDGGADANA